MIKKMAMCAFVVATFVFTGCNSRPPLAQQQHNLLLIQNTVWTLTHIGAREFKADPSVRQTPNIQFVEANKNIHGSDGCNRIMGTYQIQGEQIQLGQLGQTRMLCGQGQVATQYNEALARVASYQVYDKTLRLLDRHGNPVLQFSRAVKN